MGIVFSCNMKKCLRQYSAEIANHTVDARLNPGTWLWGARPQSHVLPIRPLPHLSVTPTLSLVPSHNVVRTDAQGLIGEAYNVLQTSWTWRPLLDREARENLQTSWTWRPLLDREARENKKRGEGRKRKGKGRGLAPKGGLQESAVSKMWLPQASLAGYALG